MKALIPKTLNSTPKRNPVFDALNPKPYKTLSLDSPNFKGRCGAWKMSALSNADLAAAQLESRNPGPGGLSGSPFFDALLERCHAIWGGTLERDPNLENYPWVRGVGLGFSLSGGFGVLGLVAASAV